jgi:GntR family histidine utilization transcriptional repressor
MTLKDRIRLDLEAKIFSGAWSPGARIPNEERLAESYACSRMTVNKVLTDLASEGLIERRRKAGSFVARPVIQSAVLRIPEIKAEVMALGYAYDYELLSVARRTASQPDRDLLGVSSKTELLELRCRHWANRQPFALEHRYVSVDAVPEAVEQDFAVMPPGTWLLQHVPWTKAEHGISALNADAQASSLLEIADGAACLVVRRRTWRAGDIITHVETIFPGAQYQLNAHFTPTLA